MEPTDFKIAQHNSLQELANHYNLINWNMHTIFVALHAGLGGWLVTSIGSLWDDCLSGAATGFLASCAGFYLAKAWKWMFDRHSLYIKAAYRRLSKIEGSLANGDEDLAHYKVHSLMRPAIEKSLENGKEGRVATNYVISTIQKTLIFFYSIFGAVALGRFLFFIPSVIDQLRSYLSAMIG